MLPTALDKNYSERLPTQSQTNCKIEVVKNSENINSQQSLSALIQEYIKSYQVEGETYQIEDWETNSESDFSEDE